VDPNATTVTTQVAAPATNETATLADPTPQPVSKQRALDTGDRRAAYADLLERRKPPAIASVPGRVAWGDEVTVTGAGFTSPTVELIAPILGPSGGFFHFPLTPFQATATSFKVWIRQTTGTTVSPVMRLVVTTSLGADTSDTDVILDRAPRIDTLIVGGAWRQAGTPQMWWQRVIWVLGRNLDGVEHASVGSTYVPAPDVWRNDVNGTSIQINVPRACSGQGPVTLSFDATRVPTAQSATAREQVTCLPNDQISSP
jgi:hypothetical protein